MRVLLPLYGSVGIQSFGVCIAIGLLICTYLMSRHKLCRGILTQEALHTIVLITTLICFVSGKLFFVYCSPIMLGLAGFSLLGSVLGVLLFLPIYLKSRALPIIPILDLFALHAPLLQSISRIGCFFSGCCYGTITRVAWAVRYTDPLSFAPAHLPLHPTQLYSAFILALVFIAITKLFSKSYTQGEPLMFYVGSISLERFVVDFFRGDREYIQDMSIISVHQAIALLLLIGTITVWLIQKRKKRSRLV